MPIDPDQFYTPKSEEMRLIGERQTLAKWRHQGKGPAFVKAGHRVLYRGADVLAWLAAQRVQPGAQQ